MFGFFYPENGKEFELEARFKTAEEAVTYWRELWETKWQEIEPRPEGSRNDAAAFMSPKTGVIVVVREVEPTP